MFEKVKIKYGFLLVLIALALFLYYSVMFNEVLLGDDVLNSCVKGNVREEGNGLFGLTFNIVKNWIMGGRIYPIPFFVTYYFFYFTGENILIYKIVAAIYNILCILLFSSAISKFMCNSTIGGVLAILLGVAMPVFTFVPENPFHAYMFMVPNVLLFASLSFLLLHSFFVTSKRRYLWLSGLFCTLSLYCYEIAYVFPMLLLGVVCLCSSRGTKIKNLIPIFVVTGIPVLCNCIWTFTHNVIAYGGTKISLSKNFFKAFFYNFVSVLPFSSWLVAKTPDYLFHNPIVCYTHIKFTTLLAMLILIFCAYFIFRESTNQVSNKKLYILVLFGMIIWGFPCFLLSLSSGWRDFTAETHFPWIPILMSFYGFVTVLLGGGFLLANCFQKLRKFSFFFISIVIILVLPIYSHSYGLQYESLKDIYETPRKIIIRANNSGFFAQIPSDSLILLDTKKTICSPQVFSMLKKDIKTDYFWPTPTETFFDKNKDVSSNAVYVAWVTSDKPYTLVLEKRNKENPELVENIISFPPLESLEPVALDESISFSGSANNEKIRFDGVYASSNSSYSWTEGRRASMRLNIKKLNDSSFLKCSLFLHSVWAEKQRVEVFVNEKKVKDVLLLPDSKEIDFAFPQSEKGLYLIEFNMPDASSPKSLGINDDVRLFSMAFSKMIFSVSEDVNINPSSIE